MSEQRVPITEDFASIGQLLRQLEQEKAKILEAPLPDVQPMPGGYVYDYSDYA
jgi:hypothetical protein